jgi:hypothetical protein
MNSLQGSKEHRAIQPRQQGANVLEKCGCRFDQRPESPRHVMMELALQRLELRGRRGEAANQVDRSCHASATAESWLGHVASRVTAGRQEAPIS